MNTIFDILVNSVNGILTCINPFSLFMIIGGLLLGMVTSALPGLTLITGIILVLPFTYSMDATNAIILITAIYLAGTYGGVFPAVLFKIPGDPTAVPLVWDGYPMAQKGQAALALGWTLYAAVFGGLFAAILMVLVSEPLAKVALSFSSPEYFAIVFLGLTSVLVLGSGKIRHSVVSLALGLLIASIGIDGMFGVDRFTFNTSLLRSGVDYLIVLVGIYAVAEIFARLEKGFGTSCFKLDKDVGTTMPSFREVRAQLPCLIRGSILGTFIGFIPGAGATVAAFLNYGVEKQYGHNRKMMGKGAPEGLISTQTGATGSVGGALIPLLTLGIPGSGATAIILGAFMMHGIQPGPGIFFTNGDMIYAIYASLFIGLLLMAIMGYLAVKPVIKVLQAPEAVTAAFILVLCCIGSFALRNNIQDVWMLFIFGMLGYLLDRFEYPIAPLVLGVILGPLAERSFLTTMVSFHNDCTVFFTRPISGVFMIISIVSLLVAVFLPLWKEYKQNTSIEDNVPN
ncbi:MAG: tripartite tricarboxylate transporter permease [Dehalobacterium sp.]